MGREIYKTGESQSSKITKLRTGENKGTKKVKYSFLTFVLLLCVIELCISNMQNINKTIAFSGKIKGLEAKRDQELDRNKQLKSEIKNFNSDMTLESIARNNLKMAGQNEILVIINKQKENPLPEEKSSKKTKKEKQEA